MMRQFNFSACIPPAHSRSVFTWQIKPLVHVLIAEELLKRPTILLCLSGEESVFEFVLKLAFESEQFKSIYLQM